MRTGAEYLRSLRRSAGLARRRTHRQGSHRSSRLPRRPRARSQHLFDIAAAPEDARAHDVSVAQDGRAGVARGANPAHARRPSRPTAVLGDLGGSNLRADGGARPTTSANSFTGLRRSAACSRRVEQQKFADNVVAFYEHMRDNHLFASYAIVPPQIDRSKPAHKQSDPRRYAGVVKERDDGIVISGAQQLATAALFSDYLHLACIHPLQPGDENYANSGRGADQCAPGLRLYPRRPSRERGEPVDYPLTSRFDEADCFCVFDNVFVPWEHVFVYRNLESSRPVVEDAGASLTATIRRSARYATKLRFMMGLAKRMNGMTGNDAHPGVNIEMGELAAFATHRQFHAAGAREVDDDRQRRDPVALPGGRFIPSMALQSELNGRMLETIRELAGAAMITLPSSARDSTIPPWRPTSRATCSPATPTPGPASRPCAWVGFPRLRVRQPACAVREILRRRPRSW